MPGSTDSGLSLRGLSRRLGHQTLLDQLSLEVPAGEILALLGPSGCGKSTVLRLIAGLDPVSAGEVWLGGRNVTALPPGQRQVAMVFQSYALYPHLTVERNLSLGMELRGETRQTIARELQRVLTLLKLDALRLRRPAQLSGGQRQRVALARALLRRPALFLLDEPMSNLDAQLRDDLRAELRDLLGQTGAPVIYVTHDQQEAMGLADRIAVLREGRLQQLGTSRELYESPVNRFVAGFLGSPTINLIRDGEDTQLGLRPERVQLQPASTALPNGWKARPGRVVHWEWLGDRVISHVACGPDSILKVVSKELCTDDDVQVRWRASDELRFNRRTGERLSSN
ncbi:MAG: ABC transporter ATP-binding protein [Cyanobacteriota bacterium]|nr:ABC transporter ATP-binding protein [Cyanobacteriota bacterium]